MSYKATNWAYELPVKGAPKNVLVALADMADESNQCYPGQKRIADMVGRSPKTVERALKWLEAQGLVSRVHRHGVGGYRTSDRYQLHIEITSIDLTDNMPTRQNAYKAGSLQGNLSHLTDTVSSPNRQGDGAMNHQLEPSDEPPVVLVQSEFDDWWAVYPRKQSKSAARAAFVKARKTTDLATLIAGAQAYTLLNLGQDKTFLKLPAGWLKDRRWEDEALPSATPRSAARNECLIHEGYPLPCYRCELDADEGRAF